MKPLKDYFIKYYEKATIDQIADDYRERGYTVKKEIIVGPYRVDLIAKKGDETVYIELKSHSQSPEAKHRIKAMADYFKTVPNAKFIVVVSRIPELKKIEFEDIEAVLFEYFTMNLPSELDTLSTHTRIDELHRVKITEICIRDGVLQITCKGMIGVTLQYGSYFDQEGNESMYMSYPFKFKGIISYDGKKYIVKDCEELAIDTDAYYE